LKETNAITLVIVAKSIGMCRKNNDACIAEYGIAQSHARQQTGSNDISWNVELSRE
jgi:hypothetical protein